MKQSLGFIKTTAIGGLVVIIPLAIIVFFVAQILFVALGVVEEIATRLPFEFLENPIIVALVAVATIIGICFLTGLAVQTVTGASMQQRVDSFMEQKIPLYAVIRSITRRFVGINDEQLTPAEIDLYGTGTGVLGFVMERLPDGRHCVFVPDSPLLTVGRMYVVSDEQIRRLPGSMQAAAEVVTQWGVGLTALYQQGNETTRSPESPPTS